MIKKISIVCLFGFSTVMSGNVMAQGHSDEIAKLISQERAKQIARQISNNIARRISEDLTNAELASIAPTASLGNANPLAASADDVDSWLPDAAWVTSSWSEISDDSALNTHVDADIYQVTGGLDKQLGDWFFGLSTTYAYTETEIGGFGSQSDTHTVTVTPYAAYVINNNFFISALTGYSYSRGEPDVSGINADTDTDEYTSELDLNGLQVIGDWTLNGKAGLRYSHTDRYFDNGTPIADNDQDNWTYLVDAQVTYSFERFIPGLRMSAGALYEYTETEDGEDDGVLYMGTGIDYYVSKSFTVGMNYSHDVNNEDIDINSVGFNLRLAL